MFNNYGSNIMTKYSFFDNYFKVQQVYTTIVIFIYASYI